MTDTAERIEDAMEQTFQPGCFIPEGGTFELVDGLQQVRARIDRLLDEGCAAEAVRGELGSTPLPGRFATLPGPPRPGAAP